MDVIIRNNRDISTEDKGRYGWNSDMNKYSGIIVRDVTLSPRGRCFIHDGYTWGIGTYDIIVQNPEEIISKYVVLTEEEKDAIQKAIINHNKES